MQCPRCHQDNPSQAKFCPECGTPADGVASSYADLKAELKGLRSSLGEALEQQTATAEILRVIASSMYREMGMNFWLEKAEAELGGVER